MAPLSSHTDETFAHFLSSHAPESVFISRNNKVTTSCRQILSHAFSAQSLASQKFQPSLGPLSKIHCSQDFMHDQIWEQLELRNKSLLPVISHQLKKLEKGDNQSATKSRVTFAPSPGQHKHLVSPSLPPTLSEENSFLPHPSSDGGDFFNEADMNTFVDDAAKLAEQGKLVHSDEDSTYSSQSSESEQDNQPFYSDFFDPAQSSDVFQATDSEKAANVLSKIESPFSGTEQNEAHTPLQDVRERTRLTIKDIEESNVKPKPWLLRGEVSAHGRPKDSLLETDIQHDIAVRPTSFVHSDTSQAIEDIIKQRIIDGLYDDVTLALEDGYRASGRKTKDSIQLPEISQEKPSEGLADVYAREFTEEQANEKKRLLMSTTVQRHEEEPKTNAQKEVDSIFEKLSEKLNSLSNLHFTPGAKDPHRELTVMKSNLEANVSKEAVPDAVSVGDLLAPHEVFTADKASSKGEVEMSKQERKAKRRANKARRKKAQELRKVTDKSVSHFDGVEADKRRAETVLERINKKARMPASTKGSGHRIQTVAPRAIDGATYDPKNEHGRLQNASNLAL